jgi:hypothetical protein
LEEIATHNQGKKRDEVKKPFTQSKAAPRRTNSQEMQQYPPAPLPTNDQHELVFKLRQALTDLQSEQQMEQAHHKQTQQ